MTFRVHMCITHVHDSNTFDDDIENWINMEGSITLISTCFPLNLKRKLKLNKTSFEASRN